MCEFEGFDIFMPEYQRDNADLISCTFITAGVNKNPLHKPEVHPPKKNSMDP